MVGKRKSETHLMTRLYVRRGRRTDTYFTLINRKYIGLGNARDQAERTLLDLVAGKAVSGTISDMAARYLAHCEALIGLSDSGAISERTLSEYREAFEKHLLPVFGAMAPVDFRSTHAAQYLEKMRDKGRAIRANREIAALSSAFSYASRYGIVESNPCYGVRRNRETPRSRKPTRAEMNRFLEIAKAKGESSYMVALIGLMVAMTGRRRAEVMGLRVSAIGDEGIAIDGAKVKPGETPRVYLVQWSPLLREIIAGARALEREVGSLFLFPNRSGQEYTNSGFKTMWGRVMTDFVKQGGLRFTAHDLRAMYVTETIEAGDNPETHSNPATMHRVYDRRRTIKVKPLA